MIAYDTNILIYALEGTGEWAASAQQIVLRGEREDAVLSVLAWQELMTGAALHNGGGEAKLAQILQDLTATKFVPVTQTICNKAVDLTKKYGKQIYGYDAIHLATAIEHGATCFITNDKVLLRLKIDELPIKGL